MKLSVKLYFSLLLFSLATILFASKAAAHGAIEAFHSTVDQGGRLGSPQDLRLASVGIEGSMNADDLVTINGIPWAANGWPFSKVLEIQRDSIDSSIVGRVVLDRHGEDGEPELGIREPFNGPEPGRAVVVSNWGSNNSGCFVEMIIQIATNADKEIDPKAIVPTQLDMMVNKQRVTLKAIDAPGVDRYGTFKYTYRASVKKNGETVSVKLPGVWSLSRHLFAVNASQAAVLRSAPAQKTLLRMTLANRSPITIPLGKGTVERWSSVYEFNSSCKAKRN